MGSHAIIFIAVCVSALLLGFGAIGSDGRTPIISTSCFSNYEKHCNADFIEVYKNLSVSETGITADTYFLLFTRMNREEPEKLHKCAGGLPPESNFNHNKRIIIVVSGWNTDYCLDKRYVDWKELILNKEDANVIMIDYNWVGIDYLHVHSHIKLIAQQIAVLLNNIKEQTGVEKLNIMAMGFSLGGQVIGYLGKLYELQNIKAVDPAGPLFDNAPDSERVSRTDAKLVEFWHCNAGVAGAAYDGGHYNYYINGGSVQKACSSPVPVAHALDVLGSSCSHITCPLYLKESISCGDCQFIGVKCPNYTDFRAGKCRSCGSEGENCLIVGYYTDKLIKEIPQEPQRFFVETNRLKPFCNNDYVDLDGYESTYRSFLQNNSCRKED